MLRRIVCATRRVTAASLRPGVLRTADVMPRNPATVALGAGATAPVRRLNLHEHDSLDLMRQYGVPVPRSKVAHTPDEAESIYEDFLKTNKKADVVMKAQVLAGGRGLGVFSNGFQGGVQICTRPGQARELASKMLNQHLITKQTGEEGRPVHSVLLMERLYIRKELYFSIVMDRTYQGPVMVASSRGGTSIEDVAKSSPDLIAKQPVADMVAGPSSEELEAVVSALGFEEEMSKQEARDAFANLYRMFIERDATLLEVNPLAETPEGHIYVADAKINFDDNAKFRQSEIFALRDETQEDPREVRASKADLNYIGLDGDIGCMVNGAGLAMATMDIIKLNGGNPANFLDVGGGATERQVVEAFNILNSDDNVRAILVNIFGGIMRCDVIAQGIVTAASAIGLKKPLVVRLRGTQMDAAKEVIESSGFRMVLVDDLDEAASKAVKMADIVRQAQEVHLDVSFELPL